MRIALVTDCYHPTPNGVTGVVDDLRAGLRARGHQVVLAAPAAPATPVTAAAGARRAELAPRSVSVLPSVSLRLAAVRPATMQRWLAEHDVEVVHTHTEGPLGLAARRAAIDADLPMVHTLHTLYDHYLHYLRVGRVAPRTTQRSARRALTRFLAPATRLIAPSAAAMEHLAVLAPGVPVTLVPNGVAVPAPRPDAATRARVSARLGLTRSDRVLLTVGRLAPEKRSRALVDALGEAMAAASDDVVAVLVGEGPQLTALRRDVARRGLSHRLRLPGRLAHADVLALHHLAAVCVSASLSENHPLSLLEAAAAGRPIAVRDDPNLRELVTDGVNGIVARSDAELASRALALARDPAACRLAGARSAAVARRFGTDAHLDATEAVYAEVARHRRAAPPTPARQER